MKQFTSEQKKIFIAFGLFDLVVAAVLVALIFNGTITLPIFIPLLFAISATVIIFLGLKN